LQYERYVFDAFTRQSRAHRRARHRHGDRRIFGDGLCRLCRKLYEKTKAEKTAAGRIECGNAKGGSGFGIGENGIFVRIVQKNDYCRRNHFFRVRIHILTIAYDYTFTSCYTIGYAQLRSIPPMRATESRKIKRTGNRILFSSTGCFFISFTSMSTAAQPRRNTS